MWSTTINKASACFSIYLNPADARLATESFRGVLKAVMNRALCTYVRLAGGIRSESPPAPHKDFLISKSDSKSVFEIRQHYDFVVAPVRFLAFYLSRFLKRA